MQSDGEGCSGQHELNKVQKLSAKSSQIKLPQKQFDEKDKWKNCGGYFTYSLALYSQADEVNQENIMALLTLIMKPVNLKRHTQ